MYCLHSTHSCRYVSVWVSFITSRLKMKMRRTNERRRGPKQRQFGCQTEHRNDTHPRRVPIHATYAVAVGASRIETPDPWTRISWLRSSRLKLQNTTLLTVRKFNPITPQPRLQHHPPLILHPCSAIDTQRADKHKRSKREDSKDLQVGTMSDVSHDPTQCLRVKLVKFGVIRANGRLKESFELREPSSFSLQRISQAQS